MINTSAPEYLIKAPSERRYYTMDFSNLMASSETLTLIDSITSEKRGGGVSDLLIADSGIISQTVGMWIQGGSQFQTYRVEVQVVTSAGQVLQGDGMLRVSDK